MQNIDSYNFSGKRALVRVDFNVPLNERGEVTDRSRIVAAIPTLKKVLKEGGSLIICSHLGRPKGVEPKASLKQIVGVVEEELGERVLFADDAFGEEAKELSSNLKKGDVLLLENLRFYAEEEGKVRLPKETTDEEIEKAKEELKVSQATLIKRLASYADCYINDAFGTAHRAHLSTALVADSFKGNKMFGYIMEREVEALSKIVSSPQRPFTAIIGGAKVSSKIGVIERLFDLCDNIIIGGGMLFTFVKALGGEIGESLFEADEIDVALESLQLAKEKGVNLLLPKEVVVADSFSNSAATKVVASDKIEEGWMGLDLASSSIEEWRDLLLNSKTILWNGPVGVFEMENFAKGTHKVATIIGEATEGGTYTLVGGGDSVAAISQMGLDDSVSYLSTGGGAMLEYLQGKVLPGIAAITK